MNIALGALTALFGCIAAYMLVAAGLGVPLGNGQDALMHTQAMDIIIGVGSALAAVICLATTAIITALAQRRG